MTKFQAIVIAFFVICIIAGVAIFATYKGSSSTTTTLPSITVWGTFPASTFNNVLEQLNLTLNTPLSVTYVEKPDITTFDKDFIAALARGQGPDAILIPQASLSEYSDKVIQIPFTVLTERDFKDTYIPEAELYLTTTGSMAIPFSVDPLVMYWNRDLFTNAGLATYPKYWDDFGPVINKIDVKDVNSNIRTSAIALGEFSNITHAREILSTLLMQSGNPITTATSNGLVATIGNGTYQGQLTSAPAVSFFIRFSNPEDPLYSWNRGLPSSESWFLSGNLATYFGFASELYDIRNKNPNLDFDVAPLPQAKNAANRVTYGNMYGFSIVRSTKNSSGTYSVLQLLTAPAVLAELSKETYLPPVRRDMIAAGSTDPYQTIFLDSALISRGWLDTDTTASNQIFQNMIESITSGKTDVSSAIDTANGQLNLSFQGQ